MNRTFFLKFSINFLLKIQKIIKKKLILKVNSFSKRKSKNFFFNLFINFILVFFIITEIKKKESILSLGNLDSLIKNTLNYTIRKTHKNLLGIQVF